MPVPSNPLKAALASKQQTLGLWLDFASPTVAELAGHCGFDWCLIDAEHGPNGIAEILAQAQALQATPASAMVRIPQDEPWMFKQVLDIGVQNILVPMVDTPQQAQHAVSQCRYPPHGKRGVGAGVARASMYGTWGDYVETFEDQLCLIVQIESRAALSNIESIAQVAGVDGVFFGPADLAADFGVLSGGDKAPMRQALSAAIAKLNAMECPWGILSFDSAEQADYLSQGATILGIGADTAVLQQALSGLTRNLRADQS